jgi:hypothetical protein
MKEYKALKLPRSFHFLNYEVTEYSSSQFTDVLLSIGIGGKIYLYNWGGFISEIDPAYF